MPPRVSAPNSTVSHSEKKDPEAGKADDAPAEDYTIESTHEFVYYDECPILLKLVVSPLVIAMQFFTFYKVQEAVGDGDADHFCLSKEDAQTMKFGLLLAVTYIASQATTTLMFLLKAYSLAVHPVGREGRRNKCNAGFWLITSSTLMLMQLAFELFVYHKVIVNSGSLEDLIKDFVALAIINEADEMVAKALKVTVKSVKGLDKADDSKKHWFFSSGFNPTYWGQWLDQNESAWFPRLMTILLFMVGFFGFVVLYWHEPCSDQSKLYSRQLWSPAAAGFSAGNPDTIAAKYGVENGEYDKNLKMAQDGANVTEVEFPDGQGAIPYAAPFQPSLYKRKYDTISLQSNGVIVISDRIMYPGDPVDDITRTEYVNRQRAVPVVAPFFANLDLRSADDLKNKSGTQRGTEPGRVYHGSLDEYNYFAAFVNVPVVKEQYSDDAPIGRVSFEVVIGNCGNVKISFLKVDDSVLKDKSFVVGITSDDIGQRDLLCNNNDCTDFDLRAGAQVRFDPRPILRGCQQTFITDNPFIQMPEDADTKTKPEKKNQILTFFQ